MMLLWVVYIPFNVHVIWIHFWPTNKTTKHASQDNLRDGSGSAKICSFRCNCFGGSRSAHQKWNTFSDNNQLMMFRTKWRSSTMISGELCKRELCAIVQIDFIDLSLSSSCIRKCRDWPMPFFSSNSNHHNQVWLLLAKLMAFFVLGSLDDDIWCVNRAWTILIRPNNA